MYFIDKSQNLITDFVLTFSSKMKLITKVTRLYVEVEVTPPSGLCDLILGRFWQHFENCCFHVHREQFVININNKRTQTVLWTDDQVGLFLRRQNKSVGEFSPGVTAPQRKCCSD